MATSKSFLEYAMEQLSGIDVTYRPMMGEYCLYCRGVLFGGLYDNRVLVKRTVGNAAYGMREEIPYNGAKPMYYLDIDDAENARAIVESTTAELAALPKKNKKK